MKLYVIIDDKMLARDDAKISIFDLAVSRGFGIFDFFKTVQNQPVWLDDHLDRFYFSASGMNMPVPLERDALKNRLQQLMDKNNIPYSGVRITLTGGYSPDGYSMIKPTLFISQEPFTYNKAIFETGIRLTTYEHQRQLPHIKTTDYLQAIRLQQYMKGKGAQELLYHSATAITECPRCNVFIVNAQDEILTPAHNILQGITRKKILQLPGFTFRETNIHPDELFTAKEIFISSTTKSIMPVLNINGRDISNGKPGNLTREVWKKLLEEEG